MKDPLDGPFAGVFHLNQRVGTGSAGTVYKGTMEGSHYTVAVKVYSGVATSSDEVDLFLKEAGRIHKRYLLSTVRYLASGVTPEGQMYLAMVWNEGETLRKRLQRRPVTLEQAVRFGRTVAWGLSVVHEAELVHRNLKPENVFLPERFDDKGLSAFPTLSDIAVARSGVSSLPPVPREVVQASQGFMAPEQAAYGKSSPAADVYSLGAMMYLCIAGMMPYPEDDWVPGMSVDELISRKRAAERGEEHPLPKKNKAPPLPMFGGWVPRGPWRVHDEAPPPLIEVRPKVPREVSDIVAGMLAPDPTRRPKASEVSFRLPREHADLGWDENEPPPQHTVTERGKEVGRKAIPTNREVDPFTDRKLQIALLHFFNEREKDEAVASRLGTITANCAIADPHCKVGCGLCGRCHQYITFTDLLPAGLFHHPFAPQGQKATPRAPTLCTDCMRIPWQKVETAVQNAVVFLSSGKEDLPLAGPGPSRRVLRDGLIALVEHSMPRLKNGGVCFRCGGNNNTLCGVTFDLCLECVGSIRNARKQWEDANHANAEEQVRKAYAARVIRAYALMRKTPPPQVSESEIQLPPRIPFGHSIIYVSLRHEAKKPIGDSEKVIDYSQKLIELLEHHTVMAIRRPDKEICVGGGFHGDSILPFIVIDFLKAQTIPANLREGLLRAAATLVAGLEAGSQYYGKNDDDVYVNDTTAFDVLKGLFR